MTTPYGNLIPASVNVRLSPKSAAEFWEQTEYLRRSRRCTWVWICAEMDKRRGIVGGNTHVTVRIHASAARKGHPRSLDLADAILIADILGHRVEALTDALVSLGDGVAMLLGHPPTGGEPS